MTKENEKTQKPKTKQSYQSPEISEEEVFDRETVQACNKGTGCGLGAANPT